MAIVTRQFKKNIFSSNYVHWNTIIINFVFHYLKKITNWPIYTNYKLTNLVILCNFYKKFDQKLTHMRHWDA